MVHGFQEGELQCDSSVSGVIGDKLVGQTKLGKVNGRTSGREE